MIHEAKCVSIDRKVRIIEALRLCFASSGLVVVYLRGCTDAAEEPSKPVKDYVESQSIDHLVVSCRQCQFCKRRKKIEAGQGRQTGKIEEERNRLVRFCKALTSRACVVEISRRETCRRRSNVFFVVTFSFSIFFFFFFF